MPVRSLLTFVCLILVLATRPADAATAVSRVDVGEGVELHLVRAGRDSGLAPVIFIPGWSTDADVWRDQLEQFGRDREVISFDPRSQGQSSIVAWGNTPEQRARDLHALMASLKLKRAPVLVGWSQGVQDIAAYIERYGDADLAGVVLVDAAVARGSATIRERPQQAADQFRLLDIYVAHQRDYLGGMMEAIITRPQAPGRVETLVETGMKTPPSIGVAALVADLFAADRTGALAKISRPALVIAAASSPEIEAQREGAMSMTQGRFEVVANAGHAVFLDQPERFAVLLRSFLDRIDASST